jgi:hypothetical protein
VLIDNLTAAIKKGGEIPLELRQALIRNFLFFKSNPHPLVSIGKFMVRFNKDTPKQEDVAIEAPSPEAATILASRQYSEKHGEYPKTAELLSKPLEPTEKWQIRGNIKRPPF